MKAMTPSEIDVAELERNDRLRPASAGILMGSLGGIARLAMTDRVAQHRGASDLVLRAGELVRHEWNHEEAAGARRESRTPPIALAGSSSAKSTSAIAPFYFYETEATGNACRIFCSSSRHPCRNFRSRLSSRSEIAIEDSLDWTRSTRAATEACVRIICASTLLIQMSGIIEQINIKD